MTRNKKAARTISIVVLLAALLMTIALLACGGDDETTESPAAATPAPAVDATPASTPAPTPQPGPEATPEAMPEPAEEGPRQIGDVEGIVFQVGDGSEATFTVTEQLQSLSLPNDAVIRTTTLSGYVSLDGGPSAIDIDLHQLSSDSSYRDRYIRQRMFPDTPTGTFTVEGLNQLPAGFTDGDTVVTDVEGQLTIGSVTTSLTFEVEARDDGEVVYIHGQTVFTWDQLQLGKPIAGPVVSLEDEVRVEILLAAHPGGDSMATQPTAMPQPAPAGTPPATGAQPAPSMPASGLLIVPPMDGNAQALLDQFPTEEAACVSASVPLDQIAMLLAADSPSGPSAQDLFACLSDHTLARMMLGGMFAMVGSLSPDTEACLSAQLDNPDVVGQVAGSYRAQTAGADSPLAMFATIPFMQCLNAEEAAAAGLGDPAQIQCFVEELGPEGLAALSAPADPEAGPPMELFQAAMKCGMGASP